MSQSNQAVEQDEQAVGQITEENVTGGQLLGSLPLPFEFDKSKTSTREDMIPFSPPPGTRVSYIVLQGFNVMYVDEDYELKNLQVALRLQGTTAICRATLRDRNLDNNGNGKEWEGTVTGLLLHFGTAA